MNFIVKEYDPIEDALQRFLKFNATPAHEREISEDDLISLVVHRVKNAGR
ncbi:MAG: hypothetical protein Q8Q11_00385 [bacterium]|nr:hypothetical protein [bacterium]MDZ4247820.1 hypothetical protein [Patescibacteria group bacterium]